VQDPESVWHQNSGHFDSLANACRDRNRTALDARKMALNRIRVRYIDRYIDRYINQHIDQARPHGKAETCP
ncbi:MAG TPA: hypothetical protein DDY14_16165, partial [Chromatiaceae bacterium]|nr:hypothetical protein [Chromatiaceae bacterium]